LAILQIPHPTVFKHFLLTSTQVLNSWYMFLFQVPVFAENFLAKENFAFLYSWGFGTSHKHAFSRQDLDVLTKAWTAEPRTLSGMLGYYRWIPSQLFQGAEPNISPTLPFLFIFGSGDKYVDGRMVTPTIHDHAPHGSAALVNGSHWVQHDVPDQVNRKLLSFIQS